MWEVRHPHARREIRGGGHNSPWHEPARSAFWTDQIHWYETIRNRFIPLSSSEQAFVGSGWSSASTDVLSSTLRTMAGPEVDARVGQPQ
jgi:hypothetical protein